MWEDTNYRGLFMSEERRCKKLSNEEIKKLEEKRLEDHRYISEELLKEFAEGKFSAFRDFVKKHKEDLVVCFRGNGNPECIDINYNNHIVWRLYRTNTKSECAECKVKINYNFARYYNGKGGCMEPMKELGNLGLDMKELKNSKVKVGCLICEDNKFEGKIFSEEFVTKSYDILKPIMDSYFSLENKYMEDQFTNSKKAKEKGISTTQYKKDPHIEKRWQQRLFQYFKNTDTGLFAYDLEFSQPFLDDIIKNKIKTVNEPDMLAIRFVDKIPKALVFIEVKSTKVACKKESGIEKHLLGMKRYSECDEFMHARKEDAGRILKQYYKSGLYQTELEGIKYLLTDDKNCGIDWPVNALEVERMLILTDNVLREYERCNYHGKSAIEYFEQGKKYKKIAADNACEVYRINGHYFDDKIEHIKIDI